jgi:hypothetical protein
LLLKLIANLNMLLRDENVNVVKKAILTMTQLYKVALQVRAPFTQAFHKHRAPCRLVCAGRIRACCLWQDVLLIMGTDNKGVYCLHSLTQQTFPKYLLCAQPDAVMPGIQPWPGCTGSCLHGAQVLAVQ